MNAIIKLGPISAPWRVSSDDEAFSERLAQRLDAASEHLEAAIQEAIGKELRTLFADASIEDHITIEL